ncbi:MAG: response regulator [Rhodocyclaceae bacterium]|nr:response regulator [Rhodocyclaceae bacterium]
MKPEAGGGLNAAGARLLVVEDDKFVQRVIERYLKPAGHGIVLANNVEDAWTLLCAAAGTPAAGFEAILLDRNLPGKNGIELLERIKSSPDLAEIPVILQTAATRPEDVAEGIAKGAFYYLAKPFSQDVLLAIVRAAVADLRSRVDLRARLSVLSHGMHLLRRMDCYCKTLEDIRPLASYLAQYYPEPERVVSGIAEFLVNAVEHGNLEVSYEEKSRLLQESRWEREIQQRLGMEPYGSRQVDVSLEFRAASTVLTISDQGMGFDWRHYLEFAPERAFDAHGRGIAMSRLFSFDDVEYRGRGNEVVLTVLSPAA